MTVNETGKGKKARHRMEVLGVKLKEVTDQLIKAQKVLSEIIGPKNYKLTKKAPASNLERIEFKEKEVCFYIDFCIVSEDDYLEGAIVYGALRVPNHPYSMWEYENTQENKPLFCLSIDAYGKINAKGKLEDEWWLKGNYEVKDKRDNENKADDKKAVKEIQYRVLDLIWRDALNWVNEALLL